MVFSFQKPATLISGGLRSSLATAATMSVATERARAIKGTPNKAFNVIQ
jgi:hypothetical protein